MHLTPLGGIMYGMPLTNFQDTAVWSYLRDRKNIYKTSVDPCWGEITVEAGWILTWVILICGIVAYDGILQIEMLYITFLVGYIDYITMQSISVETI